MAKTLADQFGVPDITPLSGPKVEDFDLPESQLRPPKTLDAFCIIDDHERLIHSLGKPYADLAHAMQCDVKHFTDMVAKLPSSRFTLLVKRDE